MKATILLPTTGDRGPVLSYSIESVLRQTEQDWELFIIGDGPNDDTRRTVQEFAQDWLRSSMIYSPHRRLPQTWRPPRPLLPRTRRRPKRFSKLYLTPNGIHAYQTAVNEFLFTERYQQQRQIWKLERQSKPFRKRLFR